MVLICVAGVLALVVMPVFMCDFYSFLCAVTHVDV